MPFFAFTVISDLPSARILRLPSSFTLTTFLLPDFTFTLTCAVHEYQSVHLSPTSLFFNSSLSMDTLGCITSRLHEATFPSYITEITVLPVPFINTVPYLTVATDSSLERHSALPGSIVTALASNASKSSRYWQEPYIILRLE